MTAINMGREALKNSVWLTIAVGLLIPLLLLVDVVSDLLSVPLGIVLFFLFFTLAFAVSEGRCFWFSGDRDD
ncbi:MAG: hypothetical protein WA782_12650 [Sulfitobacter sp.]